MMTDEEAELVGTSPTSLAVAGISFFGAADFKVAYFPVGGRIRGGGEINCIRIP
jgi:hypothetical protein